MVHNLIKVGIHGPLGGHLGPKSRQGPDFLSISGSILESILEAKSIKNPARKQHQKSMDLLMDFASKMKPRMEPEIDKIRALARLWAQMASKRATNLHVDRIPNNLARFYKDFWTILDDFVNISSI